MRPRLRFSRRVAVADFLQTRAVQLITLCLAIAVAAALVLTNTSRAEAGPGLASESFPTSIPFTTSAHRFVRSSIGDDGQDQHAGDQQGRRRGAPDTPDGAPREWKIKRGRSLEGDVRGLPR